MMDNMSDNDWIWLNAGNIMFIMCYPSNMISFASTGAKSFCRHNLMDWMSVAAGICMFRIIFGEL